MPELGDSTSGGGSAAPPRPARADLLAQEENRRAVILSAWYLPWRRTYVLLRQLDQPAGSLRRKRWTRAAEALRLFELKFKGGVVSELEVAQVQAEYEQAACGHPATGTTISP